MTLRQPARPIFDPRPNHGAEREFARRVESTFRPDEAAIARVRASILAEAPAPSVTAGRPSRGVGSFAWRFAPFGMVLVMAIAGGFAILRALPAGSSQASAAGESATASLPSIGGSPTDLDQANASLQLVLDAVRAGDATSLRIVLVAYQARLAAIALDVRQPGTDLDAARARLLSQASALSGVAAAVTPDNAGLFDQVSADLAGIIASLPAKATPPAAHPGAGHSPAGSNPVTTTKPGSSSAPGKSSAGGNGNPNSNAGGNGNGNAGGNGNPNSNAGGNGNGNAGGNGNGNAGGNGNSNAGGNGNGNAGGNGKGHGKGN